ncbi:chemotaxis protein MotB [Natranaerovirga hydrolytica]|uniref:Chemotaxis protein MotB n=1 Tax=Natranaerovirga hydrolytica TaxID=680378 RepID=A0A4R1N4M7_9FIRM|nr:flagellar motor protein MotB [Natranaerovirga hydrolytica]TCK97899.1 chemotaxis protein MotB [Natranaerovirga hydrolytica]
MARRRQQKPESSQNGAPAWMNTYGDMVTLLLCFFVLLFSMSTIDIVKFQELISSFDNRIDLMPGGMAIEEGEMIVSGISQLDDLAFYTEQGRDGDEDSYEERLEESRETAEAIEELLEEHNISDNVEVNYTAQYIQLSLDGAFLFDSGLADLKNEGIELMEIVGDILRNYESQDIAVEGHTDNIPIESFRFPSNWYLSSARAITVADYLINNKGFNPETLFAVGYGEYRPVDTNSTAQGRARNRRVEIKIVNEVN